MHIPKTLKSIKNIQVYEIFLQLDEFLLIKVNLIPEK